LSDRPTLQELLEIQQYFSLPTPALVEKDWYVVKALAAIAGADAGAFRLVFGGGTALARAYGLVKRMSEDIDLRIVADATPTRGQLRDLRQKLTTALLQAGFQFDPNNPAHRETMYEGRYTVYRLPYAASNAGKGALRPEIQIETAVFPLRREAVELPIISFVNEGYSRPPEIAVIACASILETAAEKLVALTRRGGAELAGLRNTRDLTLVRHIHDLHAIRNHYDAADVASLACQIMLADAATRARDYPAYQADPLAETLKTIAAITASSDVAADYANFVRDMVYGDVVDFRTAGATLTRLSEHLRAHLT
jgi:predicted nucleotidyltransferase component of viral defense system